MSNIFKRSANDKVYYSDLDINMTVNWNKDLSVRNNAYAVSQALINIVTTRKGSMPFDPEYGSNITSELFSTMTPFMFTSLEEELTNSIRAYEPRVEYLNVELRPSGTNKNTIEVTITFSTLYDLNDTQTLSFEITT